MLHWLYLSIAIVAEVIGTSFLKSAEGFTRIGPSIIVLVCYGIAFYLLSLTLKTIPVGIAYAVWSGVGIALIALVGWIVLGQTLDTPAIIGIGLIVSGVVVLNIFSSSTPHG
ncbi:MAG: QacE family quaternary ammonium compound efflux SMR transporter [Nitrosomonas sp.]|nr:QacE family quaternary ammonium compound efflux SMR transporter [Nitrosomonas sp.]MCW5619208.1 QacE family quaternary ammonium compound efflux SMR transporter [Nitrosomonas sp.]